MLLFWMLAALLTVGTVLAVARPLLRRPEAVAETVVARSAADVALYKQRLAEIEGDRARGLISDAEADAARTETARRLLASSEPTSETAADASVPVAADQRGTERAFFAVAMLMPLIALSIYAALGSPGLPGKPVAERLVASPVKGDVDELVARVEARLRADPRDGQGWDVLAPVYLRLERFPDAAEAFRRAIDILGESPRRLLGLAESTVLGADGIVTEPARRAYERLLELEPGRIEALLGLALAKEQDGSLDEAEALYKSLAETAPPQAPWRVFVMDRLEAIEQKRGAGTVKPPEAAAAEAVAGLPPPQQRQMVITMVEGLAQRLKQNGRDVEGWQRLLRSFTVLGETAKAEAALVEARQALAGDEKALGQLNAFAKSLGLKS